MTLYNCTTASYLYNPLIFKDLFTEVNSKILLIIKYLIFFKEKK